MSKTHCLICSVEFGNVPPEELPSIDFTLPDDHPMTSKTLMGTTVPDKFKIHIGCTKIGHKPWIGKVFPADLKESDFLSEYSKQLNTFMPQTNHLERF